MWELSYVPEGQPAPVVGPSTTVGDIVSFDGLEALPLGIEVLDEDGTSWTKMAGLEGKNFWENSYGQQVKLNGMPGESWEVIHDWGPNSETVAPPSADPPWNSLTAQLVKLEGTWVADVQFTKPGVIQSGSAVFPYKSQYGTGGKVKYLDPSECDDGDIVRDKTGRRFQVIDAKNRVLLPVPKDTTEWVSDDQLLFISTYTGRVPLVMPEGMQVRFRRVAKSIPF